MALAEGILFGLIVMFLWSFTKVVVKPAITKIGPYYSLFYEHLIVAAALAIFIMPSTGLAIPSQKMILLILISALVGAFSIYFMFRAIGEGKVSVVSPIMQSSSVVTVFLAFLIYKEPVSADKIMFIIMLIFGIILLSFRYSDIRKMHISKAVPGIGFALLSMVGGGIYYLLVKPVVMDLGPMLSTLYLEACISLVIAVPLIWKGIKNPGKAVIYTFFSGSAVAAASLLFNKGIEVAPLSIIYPLASSYPVLTAVWSYIFLKERIELNQKIAILIIIASIIMIAI